MARQDTDLAALVALMPGVLLHLKGGTGDDILPEVAAVAGDIALLPVSVDLLQTPNGLEVLVALLPALDRAAVRHGLIAATAEGIGLSRLIWLGGHPFRLEVRPGPDTGADTGGEAVAMLTGASAEADAVIGRERAEKRFRKAFQATPGLFAISDPDDGRHIDVNQRWLDVMGWQREEVIGRTAFELGVWAEPDDRTRIVDALRRDGTVRDFETRFRTRSGEVREFLIAGEIIDLDGARRLLLVALDVTERNEAQRAITALNAQLEARVAARTAALEAEVVRREKTEQRLRAIMGGVADAIITANAKGRIITFNPAAEVLFGLPATEALGSSISRLMPPAYAERHDAILKEFLSSDRTSTLAGGRQLPALRADGSIVQVELSLNHLEHEGEHLFTAVIRDISERKEYEAQLHAAKELAEDASRAKSSFLSSMSHELRTPMNAILGFAQLLRAIDGHALTPRHDEYVGHILSAGQNLLTLINDVLDLSKIEAGSITLSLEPVCLHEVINQAELLLQSAADRFGVELRRGASADEDVRVWADSMRLGQVILNLGSNAVKYNRTGGWIEFSCGVSPRTPGFLRLTVADNGHGIPPHRLPDLFQPFNRLGAEGGPVEGTGIGLSIARELVEMMGGDIGVSSNVGQGTTFWIDLPAAETADGRMGPDLLGQGGTRTNDFDGAVARRHHVTLPHPAARGGGPSMRHEALSAHPWTVLYVDDVSSNVRLMSGLLARYPNIRLLSAPTAESGLDLAMAHRPDLVVLDINLPGMDGFDTLHRLRATPELASVPVIALTAHGGPRARDRGLRAGFDAYLDKPLDVGRFLDAAAGMLAGRLAVLADDDA